MTVHIGKPILNIRDELTSLRGADKVMTDGSIESTTIGRNIPSTINATNITALTIDVNSISVDGLDLSAIDKNIEDTAADVFVYDTTLDSDQGEWRNNTQDKSWYNEELNTTTRGATRKFPVIAIIIAESNKVTIYDGDKSDMPMWMVFQTTSTSILKGSANSVDNITMLNGDLLVGSESGLYQINLISEFCARHHPAQTTNVGVWSNNIKQRNEEPIKIINSLFIVNEHVNDIAITVLPNAPINPNTGLEIPTIAVATDGGISIINNDGTVADWTPNGDGRVEYIYIRENQIIAGAGGGVSWHYNFLNTIPKVDTSQDGDFKFNQSSIPSKMGIDSSNTVVSPIKTDYGYAIGTSNGSGKGGLNLLDYDPLTPSNSMVAYITPEYNTGYMVGDIKGAWLADTVAETITALAELIPNGNFSSATDNFWTDKFDATSSVVSGQLEVVASADFGGVRNVAYATDEPGVYWVEADLVTGVGRFTFESSGSSRDFPNLSRTGPYSYRGYVELRETDGRFNPKLRTVTSGETTVWDNFSVTKVDVSDHSVNDKGLSFVGSITKSEVATGAELMGFSDFATGSSYIKQPYNSDLDFGTGDFSVMGWVKSNGTAGQNIFQLSTPDDVKLGVYVSTNWFINVDDTPINTGHPLTENDWTHFVFSRYSGVIKFHVNGVEVYSASNTVDLSLTDEILLIGVNRILSSHWRGSMSLLRMSATAPTPEQINKIYRDELPLFKENAQCTIFGPNESVKAMAYDEYEKILHLGTESGRSNFKGLVRISNTTSPITTAISASNGLIAEE